MYLRGVASASWSKLHCHEILTGHSCRYQLGSAHGKTLPNGFVRPFLSLEPATFEARVKSSISILLEYHLGPSSLQCIYANEGLVFYLRRRCSRSVARGMCPGLNTAAASAAMRGPALSMVVRHVHEEMAYTLDIV